MRSFEVYTCAGSSSWLCCVGPDLSPLGSAFTGFHRARFAISSETAWDSLYGLPSSLSAPGHLPGSSPDTQQQRHARSRAPLLRFLRPSTHEGGGVLRPSGCSPKGPTDRPPQTLTGLLRCRPCRCCGFDDLLHHPPTRAVSRSERSWASCSPGSLPTPGGLTRHRMLPPLLALGLRRSALPRHATRTRGPSPAPAGVCPRNRPYPPRIRFPGAWGPTPS